MDTTTSFKERVKNEAIRNAKLYKTNFVDFEYLVCSEAFDDYYHIIKSDKSNYLHLIGIHTDLAAEAFFDKCYNKELEASKTKDVDLIFRKTRNNEKPYSELIYGKKEDIIKYKEKISDLICQDFLKDH